MFVIPISFIQTVTACPTNRTCEDTSKPNILDLTLPSLSLFSHPLTLPGLPWGRWLYKSYLSGKFNYSFGVNEIGHVTFTPSNPPSGLYLISGDDEELNFDEPESPE